MEIENVHDCTGCGYCCVSATCVAGMEKFGSNRPCDGLKWDEDQKRHYCSLCVGDNQSAFFYKQNLHIGAGCCSSMNSWRREPLINRTNTLLPSVSGYSRSPIPDVMQHYLASLGRQMISGDLLELTLSKFKQNLIEAGYDDTTAETYCIWIRRYTSENRTSLTEGFMG